MKRAMIVALVMVAATLAVGAQTITFLHTGEYSYKEILANGWTKVQTEGFSTPYQKMAWHLQQDTGYTVRPIQMDLSTGGTMTLDAMLAAGNPPDVIMDMEGRVAKLLTPAYAVEPDKLGVDVSDWTASSLAAATRNGHLYALPIAISAATLCVNTDMLASAGYTLPAQAQWTTDEFLKMAAALKVKGQYATVLFAKNQSSDSWWMNWFIAFGAKQYANYDYSKTLLNSPQAIAALKFMKTLVDKGYAVPNPGEVDDDAALDIWAKGQAAALALQVAHAATVDSYVQQGLLAKAFTYKFVEFPHAAGVAHVPVFANQTFTVGHKSGNAAKDKAIAKWMASVAGYEEQYISGSSGNFPTLKSLIADMGQGTNPHWGEEMSVLASAGTIDRGSSLATFPQIRAAMFPLMQQFYAGKLTAEQVLSQYETAVNAILAGK
jgi:ABC-type glycerol-3-phosphate transport system substrate-binding protein